MTPLAKGFKPSIVLALALLSTSCSPGIEIKPSGFGTNVRVAFASGALFGRGPTGACVSELTVRLEKWPTRAAGEIIWQISAIKDCVRLAGVDVGHAPNGFKEVVNRLAMRIGRM